MGDGSTISAAEVSTLDYEADLCGNIEQALKGLQGYGIMALELIQNADDAGARQLVFDSRATGLVVRNDADFSSCGALSGRCPWERAKDPDGRARPCNFHAISRMGSRSKIGAPDQIGRFGIGFVSVYQITDTPVVRAGGTQLTLNPLTGKGTVARVTSTRGTEFELPWASHPSDIRSALNTSPTPPDVSTSVIAEILSILDSSLLFLRNLQRVELLENGNPRVTIDIVREGRELTLDFVPGGRRRWLVLSGDAGQTIDDAGLIGKFAALEKLDRSRNISIAVPVDGASIEGRLFAYLPTQHPTGLPIHINADFFPHASRQDIVLKGEGHERYWNEALIAAAAGIVGNSLMILRDALGPVRLWELGSAALRMKDQDAFGAFWSAFAAAAKVGPSIWTISDAWHTPNGVHLAPEEIIDPEQKAIVGIGIELIDQRLRPHASALTAVGAGELRLSTVTTALEVRQGDGVTIDNPELGDLWSAIAKLIDISVKRPGFAAVLGRLKAATYILDVDGNPTSPDGVWRLPAGIRWQDVRRYLQNCPIMADRVAAAPGITALVDEMGLDDLASLLAASIRSVEDAKRIIGNDPADARGFYTLLTAFAVQRPGPNAGSTLANTPILRTATGFIQPSRGQLPGYFRDPSGYFELIDTGLFPPSMDEFARNILGVGVLSFHQYVAQHLPSILQRGLNREQYREIIAQITTRKNELDDRGSLAGLRDLAFVRTRAGTYARPRDCYYWAAPLATIMGDDPVNWVDSSWMPSSPLAPQVQDLLEARLGMPTTVRPRHIVDRIETMATNGTPDEVAERVTPIIRHVIERWSRFKEEDLDTFRELQDLQFIPAVVGGSRDQEHLYIPGDVFRAARARGFDSQVAVIDLTPLRQSTATVGALLDLLEVPDEPKTAVVVAHLRQCMADGVAPSDLTYAILNERVDQNDDVASVATLGGSRFIYDQDLKRFVGADQVFWLPPPFRDYWWKASGRMGQRSELFRLLGVRDEPVVGNYAELMLEIAAKPDLTVRDQETHSRCVAHLCDAVDVGSEGLDDALKTLRSDSSLLTVDGDAIWPEDAIWLDSDHLAEPFGTALNHSLVAPPDASRTSAARFYRLIGTRPLSGIARLRLAAEPDRRGAEEDTELLRDRADLVLWVAPNAHTRNALRALLRDVEIRLTGSLRIQAEIAGFEPPVTSPVTSVPAFYERDAGVLHVEGRQVRSHWPAAFRVILAEVEHLAPLADMKPLIMTATLIMLSETREDAEDALRSSGFRAPTHVEPEEDGGAALGEGEDEPDLDDGDISDPGGGTTMQDDSDLEDDVHGETDPDLENAGSSGGGGSSPKTGGSADARSGGGENGGGEHHGDTYKSKAGSGGIGQTEATASPNTSRSSTSPTGSTGGGGQSTASGGSNTGGDGSRERRARTSRMRSYVARAGDRTGDDAHPASGDDDIGGLIDVAAISAVVKYETQRGWTAEVQPHNNPGYDIVSTGPDGGRRLIEVKGLESDWTERGVKLSHVQFGMAERHPDEYWIYVVERARDLAHQRVSAIANPFSKVEEYWFDDAWRLLADEDAGAQELNATVGAKVRHQMWGTGRIIDVQKSGIGMRVKIDFGFQGVKLVPFNSNIELVP